MKIARLWAVCEPGTRRGVEKFGLKLGEDLKKNLKMGVELGYTVCE